ncbi:allophanate hydrolase [uncultured Psychromonas sp.]|uniref:allophanate hydrolase n=1 Tax=uncultured Psychromonas sp. TaxID=173974 RepID=UPI0026140815|nr:allophanate hydrolase [uncultured Psychromonas sp.]
MIEQNMNINVLQNAYRSGELNVKDFLLAKLAQAKSDTSNVWISTISESQLVKMLDVLDGKSIDELPLYGVPFAVKDNIDFAMLPTTAGCEAYTFQPDKSSTVVQLLIDAGAIPFGKTNLDQFATGLVGVRSPWGAVNNSFDSEYVSGGSSSGSAVAVATGQVSFSLGTDTAGSGRVPAALNNIVGMKATKGLLSCTGVVPACKSLDCVTIFANSANEVNLLLNITGQWDETDCFSRENKVTNSIDYFQPNKKLSGLKVGLPAPEQLSFFGDQSAQILFSENVERLKKEGIEIVNINFQPFLDAAKLLYEGPWVAERYAAIEDFFKADPKQCLPVIETIIGGATAYTAVDTFKAMYRLQAYKIQCDAILAQVDCVLTPTAGCAYRIKDVEADPIQLNSNLGYYTNFMNLLDYAAIALPAGILASGLPFGITLFGPAFSDRLLLSVGAQWQKLTDLTLGATQQKVTNTAQVLSSSAADSQIDIAVCGAHLSGFPLNNQLTERGGVLVKTCNTSTDYRFYALAGGPPFRPGLIRVDDESGSAIEVEVWRLPVSNIGTFLQGIEQPLGLGKVQLDDNSWVSSFICEGYAINTAEDITYFGGWKAYIKAK